jgi:hypothetical protein
MPTIAHPYKYRLRLDDCGFPVFRVDSIHDKAPTNVLLEDEPHKPDVDPEGYGRTRRVVIYNGKKTSNCRAIGGTRRMEE